MLTDVEKAILRLTTLKDLFDDLSVNSNVVSVLLTREDERALKTAIEALEERPHGEWIYKDMKGQFCSVCDKQSVWKFNFCPNCGASMRKEGNT